MVDTDELTRCQAAVANGGTVIWVNLMGGGGFYLAADAAKARHIRSAPRISADTVRALIERRVIAFSATPSLQTPTVIADVLTDEDRMWHDLSMLYGALSLQCPKVPASVSVRT